MRVKDATVLLAGRIRQHLTPDGIRWFADYVESMRPRIVQGGGPQASFGAAFAKDCPSGAQAAADLAKHVEVWSAGLQVAVVGVPELEQLEVDLTTKEGIGPTLLCRTGRVVYDALLAASD